MIKRIGLCEKDVVALDRLAKHRTVSEKAQPKDYRNKVVLKPWGYEYLVLENQHVAVWFLHIKNGHSTSMHCHPAKKTCLILLSGGALCNTFEHRNYLNSVGAVVIDKAVFHSTKALSEGGIDVIEIETPPNKTDLVRLNDAYGREFSGYEGFTEMQTEHLEKFNHFSLEEPGQQEFFAHHSDRYTITFETYLNNAEFCERFTLSDDELCSPCRGCIIGADGEALLAVGDAERGLVLKQRGAGNLRINDKLMVLKASPRAPG